jgi:hypothetical protein
MFVRFPTDARWNPERSVIEFGIGVASMKVLVRVSRRRRQKIRSQSMRPSSSQSRAAVFFIAQFNVHVPKIGTLTNGCGTTHGNREGT